ncbi:hypothetical protein ACLMJK_008508 [Lecanora helva]
MPPKRSPPSQTKGVSAAPSRPQPQSSGVGGALRTTYNALTARENQSVVRSVGMFGGILGGLEEGEEGARDEEGLSDGARNNIYIY